jgi:hypothetical protein
MTEGYRITEGGDPRTTESGDTRVTEGFYTGAISLTSSGSVTAGATIGAVGASLLSSATSKMYAGTGSFRGVTSATATSSMTVEGVRAKFANTLLSGEGVLTVVPSHTHRGLSALSSSSTVSTTPHHTHDAALAFNGVGGFGAASKSVTYGFIRGSTEELVRVTESGDIRVTEDGSDTRVSSVQGNLIEGTIVSHPSLTLFTSIAYVKVAGVWKVFDPYAKDNSTWKEPTAVYKHTSGGWKRIN